MRTRKQYAGIAIISLLLLMGAGCPKGTKNLATASDAISHALANAQMASQQAVTQGIITAADDATFEQYLSKVAQAGQILDSGIKANESATTISSKVNVFLDAFNQLQNSGLAGIKNPALRLTIGTAINGAEASVAIIAASVGVK